MFIQVPEMGKEDLPVKRYFIDSNSARPHKTKKYKI
jgi:hypothetical protein